MASKIGIFNDALRAIGDLRLSSLTEDTEARYVLEDAWDDCVRFVFTEGLWNFATKTAVITADTGQPSIPGFLYCFNKPLNWLRTITISPNPMFRDEAIYRDEGNRIYANFDTLYIRFISSELAADEFITTWPPTFAKLVGACLAKECAERLSGSDAKSEALAADYKQVLASAKNKDALDQAKITFQPGNWLKSTGGSSRLRDYGVGGALSVSAPSTGGSGGSSGTGTGTGGGTTTTVTVPADQIASVTKSVVEATDFDLLFFAYQGLTVKEIRGVVTGASPGVTFSLYYGPNANGSSPTTIKSGMSVTSMTTGDSFKSFDNVSIPAENWVWAEVDSVTGTVNTFHFSVHLNA